MEIEKKISYAICSIPRTGSNMLCGILSEMGIGKPFEQLNGKFQVEFDMKKSLEKILFSEMKKGESANGIKGIKIMGVQLQRLAFRVNNAQKTAYSSDDIMDLLQIEKYIFLRRKNKLRQAISHYKANVNDDWHVNVGQKIERKRVKYNRFIIQKFLVDIPQKELDWLNFFNRRDIQPLEIYYEDLIENYHETLLKVVEFLGVKLPANFQFPSPTLEKQADETNEVFYNRFQNPKWYEPINFPIDLISYRGSFFFKYFYRVIKQNRSLISELKPVCQFLIREKPSNLLFYLVHFNLFIDLIICL
jgi:trehalose 2-sulfotransferase